MLKINNRTESNDLQQNKSKSPATHTSLLVSLTFDDLTFFPTALGAHERASAFCL